MKQKNYSRALGRTHPLVGWTSAAMVSVIAECLLIHPAQAGGPMGLCTGWDIDNNGNPYMTASYVSGMVAGKAGWKRVGMRLIPGHTSWDSTMLSYYDTVINNLRSAGMEVLILVNNESWVGSQSDWNANAIETGGTDGSNSYEHNFAQNCLITIMKHFQDRVHYYEVWNEPNVGGSYMYPSVFAKLMADCYADMHYFGTANGNYLILGAVYGGNYYGFSYGYSGAQYIDDTYNMGINGNGSWTWCKNNYGSYPPAAIGEHLYLDQSTGALTSSANVQQYINWVKQAYAKYEGSSTSKKIWVTEFGYTTSVESEQTQDTNLKTVFGVIENNWQLIPHAFWFEWQDNSAAGLYYGILRSDGSHKLCYPDFQWEEQYEGYYGNGTINNNILNYFNARGQAVMGNAYDNGGSPWVHTWSGGSYSTTIQDFEAGSNKRLAIFTTSLGTYQVNDIHGLWGFYLGHGGIGHYGAPANDEYAYGSGTRQDFQAHYLTWDPTNGVIEH